MAEAGPSSQHCQSFTNGATPPPAQATAGTASKASRIQFPQGHNHGKFGSARSNSLAEMAALGFGQPPLSRRTTHNGPGNGLQAHTEDVRPRVKSADAGAPVPGPSRIRKTSDHAADSSRKITPVARKSHRKDRMRADPSDINSHLTPGTSFSDEYDLAHEDPRIYEDVQRALRLKARREARIRALQQNTNSNKDASSVSDSFTGSSVSPANSSPLRAKFNPLPIVPPPSGLVAESEIDFSPSVGTGPSHPVPTSSNSGATLDWTGSTSDDEKLDRRWSISIMRKNRDKTPMPNRSATERQDALYADKISRIRERTKPNTLRKAEIIRDQLERRYAALLSPAPQRLSAPVDLLSVAKWYNEQDAVVQAALDKSEPPTWLKHLLNKHGRDKAPRFPWHLTALIIEEYVRSKARPEAMETIPEDAIIENVTSPASPKTKSPSSGSWSYTPPYHSLEPSLSRRRVSNDGQISFEPQVDSGRESVGDEYRASIDYSAKSPRTSFGSASNGHRTHGLSPSSSRHHFRDITQRLRKRPYAGSEEGLSSTRNSISEQSQEEDPGYRSRSPTKKTSHRPYMQLSRSEPVEPVTDDDRRPLSEEPSEAGDLAVSSGADGPTTARQLSYSLAPSEQPATEADSKTAQLAPRRPRLPRKRYSLPSPHHQFVLREKERQQRQLDDEQERRDYERKNQLLEDLVLQNWRTRQVLQRVGANIREYENVQKSLASLLGVQYTQIPQELLDAFSHDPASVVSSTKRFKDWRAVEDIHHRMVRQRDILQNFVASNPEKGIATPPKSIFDEPIASLTNAMDRLEVHRRKIVREAETVMDTLARVKDVHSLVKREYNETTGHTSLVYPELSQIISLEESYTNKYQQLWNIALDALTLLLDTITPFWRNYGKVIGDDIQDFLIIPWYRNEFTGEAKRYPIKSFPRRSFRHWVGLLIFSTTSVLVIMLQIRAAWSSTINYNLPWIKHSGFRWMFIPFFGIGLLIQWIAVLFNISIVLSIFCIVVWWLGWTIKIFH